MELLFHNAERLYFENKFMIDILGYIGTIVVLYSFTIENIKKLRLVNSIGSMFWIGYGIGIMAWPTIVVNACVLAIHSLWFYKHRKELK